MTTTGTPAVGTATTATADTATTDTATATDTGSPVPVDAPGPTGPIAMVRNIRALQKNAPELFQRLSRTHGDLVRLPLGPYLTHLNLHPDGVRHVLAENNANYVRGRMYERFKIFFGIGLLTTDGDQWRGRRRTVNPLFHRNAVEAMGTSMTDATAVILDRWQAAATAGHPVEVVSEMVDLSLGALGELIFGTDLWPQGPRVGPAMAVSLEAMIFKGSIAQMTPDRIPTPYNRRIRRAQAVLDEAVRAIITDHLIGPGPRKPDLVDLLLAARDDDGGDPARDPRIHDEMKTIFMAGHETTGTGLAWALYEVAANPAVQRRLAEEADTVLAGRVPQFGDLSRLTYTRQVVDETLRLHPPIWLFPRDAVAEDAIRGRRIPGGSSVFMCPYVTHRNPEFWARPEEFDPDRFTPDAAADRPRFSYFPFGGGQRQCIGNQMALMQMQLTLAMTAQRYRLGLASGHRPEIGTLVSLRPLRGVALTVRTRRR